MANVSLEDLPPPPKSAALSVADLPPPPTAASTKGDLGESLKAAGHDVLGAADVLGTGILNIPHNFAYGGANLVSRALGQGPVNEKNIPGKFDLSQPGKDLVGGVRDAFPGTSNGLDVSDEELRSADPTGKVPIEQLRQQYAAERSKPLSQSLEEAGGTYGAGAGATVRTIEDIGNIIPGLQAGKTATNAVRAGLYAIPNATEGGLVGQRQSTISNALAGPSGTTQRVLQNQKVGNTIAANDIAHDANVAMTPESVQAARAPANAVYNRAAGYIPTAPLTADAQTTAAVRGAGTGGGRITNVGSPQVQQHIAQLKGELLSGQPVNGDQVVKELGGLRQDAFTNLAAEDVDKRVLGRAQLELANALEDHIGRNLPANAPVSLDQLQAARTLLAKNSTVASVLKGNDIDMQALGRMYQENPGLLTDGLEHIGKFAAENRTVSSLGSAVPDASVPSIASDLKDISLTRPGSVVQAATGALGRRMVAGRQAAGLEAANRAFPPRGTADLDPLVRMGPSATSQPVTVPYAPPAAQGLSLADELGAGGPHNIGRPAPEIHTAEPPPGHRLASTTGAGGEIPLADMLSTGVEQRPPAGLSVASGSGLDHPGGVPFTLDPSFMSRGLSLADELAPSAGRENLSDVAGVRSQGVPEVIVTRTGTKPNLQPGDTIEPPKNQFQRRKRVVEQ